MNNSAPILLVALGCSAVAVGLAGCGSSRLGEIEGIVERAESEKCEAGQLSYMVEIQKATEAIPQDELTDSDRLYGPTLVTRVQAVCNENPSPKVAAFLKAKEEMIVSWENQDSLDISAMLAGQAEMGAQQPSFETENWSDNQRQRFIELSQRQIQVFQR